MACHELVTFRLDRIVGLSVKKEPNGNISLYTLSYVMCGRMLCLVNISGVRFQKEYLENFVRVLILKSGILIFSTNKSDSLEAVTPAGRRMRGIWERKLH